MTSSIAKREATIAASAMLLLLLSLSSGVSADHQRTGGFQSGPSPGSMYAGGMHYDSKLDTVYMTGSHYNIDFISHDGTSNDLMQGTELDGSSSCFVGKLENVSSGSSPKKSNNDDDSLDFDNDEDTNTNNDKSFHTLSDWKSYGDPGVMETCSAITTDKNNQAFVVGSVAKGGFFHKVKKHKLVGLTAVLNKKNLNFLNAAIETTDSLNNDNGQKNLLYPMSVIHSNIEGEQKYLYIAALTSTNNKSNDDAASLNQPNMQKVHMYGTSFHISVLKMKFKLNNNKEPQLVWIQDFPIDNDLNTGDVPPAFIGGMLQQIDSKGVNHLLIAGSTRGSGTGYGASAPDSDDEDGFIMQLNADDGSFLYQKRHKGKKNKKKNSSSLHNWLFLVLIVFILIWIGVYLYAVPGLLYTADNNSSNNKLKIKIKSIVITTIRR